MIVYHCAEDSLGRAVGLRLLSTHEAELVELLPRQGGNAAMRARFKQYCALAQHHPTLILTDLDTASCVPELRSGWIGDGRVQEPLPQGMVFCIAVREVETWLLADAARFADYMGVSAALIGGDPESLADPKGLVVRLARRSRKKLVRTGVPPAPGSSAKVGLEYNPILETFACSVWEPEAAAENSASLRRAISRIGALTA